MHYLITGHTGFKGAWLTLWLNSLGHKVSGISLDPISGALFETAHVADLVENDLRIDIRNASETADAIKGLAPDVVFHMAAQPLVRESYRNPRVTIETNVMGTLNVIEAVSATPSVRAQVVVTTDKVYRNINEISGYVESDPLGGDDPYSASKAMADILTQSWVSSFNAPPTTIVRAGNVIGGGDVSAERLIPDLINSYSREKKPLIRYPKAVRPWQHVLDCLNGYLLLSQALLNDSEIGAVNIGPDPENFASVEKVVELVKEFYGTNLEFETIKESDFKEALILTLDSSKIQRLVKWKDKLSFENSIKWTVEWYKNYEAGAKARDISLKQIQRFNSF